ncbi:MAG: peroxidase-related enzyme [bacterium]|nr:peroxidase-related enzyme [bacterium]
MPHINVSSPFPGITGLLEERLDSSEHVRDLTQALLRGPSSLTEGERELIATLVSSRNACKFCTNAHAYTAARYVGGMDVVQKVMSDHTSAPVSERMHALLTIAALVQGDAREVDEQAIAHARKAGASDLDIHDTVLTAALFCFYNRYVDGLASDYPATDSYYETLAERLTTNGYERKGLTK